MIIGPWAVVFNVMKVPEFHERCYTIVAITPFSCAHPGFLLADSTLDEWSEPREPFPTAASPWICLSREKRPYLLFA